MQPHGILYSAGLFLVVLAAASFATTAGAEPTPMPTLVERPLPFDAPASVPFPNTRLLAAAPGSNGTLHAVVLESNVERNAVPSLQYVWLNATTGEALESRPFNSLGEGFPCLGGCTAAWAEGGDVMVALGLYANRIDLFFFEEGRADAWVERRIPVPFSNITSSQNLVGLAIAVDERPGALPLVIWERSHYPPQDVLTEIGIITADPRNATASPPSTLATLLNKSVEPMLNFGWRGWLDTGRSVFSPIAGAVADDGLWVFFAACPAPFNVATGGRFYALSPLGNLTEIGSIGAFSSVFVSAAIAPDGTVAAAAYSSWAAAYASMAVSGWFSWAQVAGGTVNASWTGTAGAPATGLSLVSDGTSVSAYVAEIGNDPGGPTHIVRRGIGWPGPPTFAAVATSGDPVLIVRGFRDDVDVVLAVTRFPGPSAVSHTVDSTHRTNSTYGPTWPFLWRLNGGAEVLAPFASWHPLIPSPLVSVSRATLANGTELVVAVFLENGTPRLHLLARLPSGGPYTPIAGPSLGGEVSSAHVVAYAGVAVVAVELIFPRYEQWLFFTSGSWYWPGYSIVAYFTVDLSVGPGAAVYVDPTTEAASNGIWWRLDEDSPDPLLIHSLGIFTLQPGTGGWTRVRAFPTQYYLYDTALWNVSRVADVFLQDWYAWRNLGDVTLHAIDFWMRGTDLYAALPVLVWSPCYCLKIQVTRIAQNGTVTTIEETLTAGPGNDTVVNYLTGDVLVFEKGPDSVRLAVLVRQTQFWERLFVVTFNETMGQITSAPLIWEAANPSLGLTVHPLRRASDGFVLLSTSEAYAEQYYQSPFTMTLTRLLKYNDSGLWSWPILAPSATLGYMSDPLLHREGAVRDGVVVWALLGAPEEPRLMVGEPNRPHYLGPNGPPSVISLISPTNGSWVFGTTVDFRVAVSSDPDGDALTYRFTVVAENGNIVADLDSGSNFALIPLPDGSYRWWATVTDGVDSVPSPEWFAFRVDSAAPTASAGGPYVIYPGDDLELDGSLSSDAWGIDEYTWRVAAAPASGLPDLEVRSTAPSLVVPWADLAPYFDWAATLPISLTVRDPAGRNGTASSWVSLIAVTTPVLVEPVLLTARPAEGSPVLMAANVTWGNRSYLWTEGEPPSSAVTVYWQLSSGTILQGIDVSYDALQSGTFVAVVTAVFAGGGLGSANLTIVVANLPPVITLSGPLWLSEREEAVFEAQATDPSPADALALRIEWSVEGGLIVLDLAGSRMKVRATADGTATVIAVALDPDGGVGEARLSVHINETALAATGLRVTRSETTSLNLSWDPFEEEDVVQVLLRAWFPNGTLANATMLAWTRGESPSEFTMAQLLPNLTYRIELVVLAKGGVPSDPVFINGTTEAEPGTPSPPPAPPPPPPGPEPNASTAFSSEVPWIAAVLLAGAAAALALALARERRRRPPE